MKKFATLVSVAALLSLSSVAYAGGPLKTKAEAEPVVIRKGSSSSVPGGSLFSLGGAGGAAVAAGVLTAVLFGVSQSSGSHGSNLGS